MARSKPTFKIKFVQETPDFSFVEQAQIDRQTKGNPNAVGLAQPIFFHSIAKAEWRPEGAERRLVKVDINLKSWTMIKVSKLLKPYAKTLAFAKEHETDHANDHFQYLKANGAKALDRLDPKLFRHKKGMSGDSKAEKALDSAIEKALMALSGPADKVSSKARDTKAEYGAFLRLLIREAVAKNPGMETSFRKNFGDKTVDAALK
ncbi:MAG: hypothetical protein AB3N13_15500 [Arenibacterium sp.]